MITIYYILICFFICVLGMKVPIQDITDSFSIEELNKIKFLIKFAKVNNIMDKINEMKGEFIFNDTSKWNLEGLNNYNKGNTDINDIKRKLNLVLNKVDNIENLLLRKQNINNNNEFLNIIKNKANKGNFLSKPSSTYSPLLTSNNEIDIDDDDEYIRKNLQHKK